MRGGRRSEVVVEYDPDWPRRFDTIRGFLAPGLADCGVRIEHIGSTAVPGLAAKPVIDIDVVADAGGRMAAVVVALARLGYEHRGDLGITGREAFSPPPGLPEHHLYVVADGSSPYRDHVDLRDHLRRHSGEAARYAAEKRRLAHLLPTDRDAYVSGKAWIVTEMLVAARSAAAATPPPKG